jgi:FlaA1/EpsC-like NDP-sugar epimerase
MSRYLTRGLSVVLDLAILSVAYWLAFLFRFEFSIPTAWLHATLLNWGYIVVLQYATLAAFGVPRYSWRYVSMREMVRIGLSTAVSATVLILLRVGMDDVTGKLRLFFIPFGVIAMNAALAFLGLVAARAVRRLQGEARERARRTKSGGDRVRVLLIGAGQAGVMVAREIQGRPDLGLHAVGFLDDDRAKVGMQIGGLNVLGTTDQLAAIADRKHVERVLITIAQAPGEVIRKITERCTDAGLDTKIIPGIYEIVGDQVNLSRLRDVAIEDLLGREPVQLDEPLIEDSISGRAVMITGAGGSIGSELCRQVARYRPSRLILVEQFENALFEIHRELRGAYPDLAFDPRVADVTDTRRMTQLFDQSTPHIVFHAAAHKHVPMMEDNPGEAIKNNIGGTRTVAELAARFGVARFVMVSTDKAVNPSSVMGATKRVAEIVCQSQAAAQRATRFVTVRFGNVLGSNGSVIPIFKEQIAKGGPVTVTHPEMSRYFMTIPEAAQLVMQAGAMGLGGEIFILDMGKPVKIVDLANDLITLSGLRPGEDIEIKVTGVRPGEKLFEELSTGAESADKTKHPKIFIGRVGACGSPADVMSHVRTLLDLADTADADTLRTALGRLVPEYKPAIAVERAAAVVAIPDAIPDEARATTRRTGPAETLPVAPAIN